LWNENENLAEAGLKESDVIEFNYELKTTATMACRIPDVVIVIEGIRSNNPEFTLNGHNIPDRIEKKEGAYHFYFDYIGECNPLSWIGKMILGDKIYFLANPRDISGNKTDVKLRFDFAGEGN
jgi:hypothetical protein